MRLECGRSREEVGEHLIEEARRDPGLVVGLDFAFSFPAAFLEKRGHRQVETVWEEAEVEGETWLAECPSPPFWGKPGKRKPALGGVLFRATDRAVERATGQRPLSVFQIGGAGAVGVGSIRGMPTLRRLRGAGFSIWPFDAATLPAVVEIWPRLFMGDVTKSKLEDRRDYLTARHPALPEPVREVAVYSDDAFDALVSGLAMDRHREELGRLQRAKDRAIRLEGAIWLPSSARSG